MNYEPIGGIKFSTSDSKEKLFRVNSNLTSNEVSSMIEQGEDNKEEIDLLGENNKNISMKKNPIENGKKVP